MSVRACVCVCARARAHPRARVWMQVTERVECDMHCSIKLGCVFL